MMWIRIYQISSIIALLIFAKMQYDGESFDSETRSSGHSSGHTSGGSHHTFHK